MKTLTITNSNKLLLLDDEDYIRVSRYNWRENIGVIQTAINRKTVSIGRFILNYAGKLEIDHADGSIYNNQKSNLRFATHAQNCSNRGIEFRNTSGYKGVSYVKKSKKFVAYIRFNGERIHLGYFKTAEKAALAYNDAAIKFFKEFAYLNRVEISLPVGG